MLDYLPDIVVLNILRHLPYSDRFRMEAVSDRFKNLMPLVWAGKKRITYPQDLYELNAEYSISSYFESYGREMNQLILLCPNLREIRFKTFYNLQIVMQPNCIRFFEQWPIAEQLRELYIDTHYVTDVDTIGLMSRVFPNLEKLSILIPYPMLHKFRHDTMGILRSKLKSLEPQIWPLIDDNEKVTEDIRLVFELFPTLRMLRLKDAVFEIKG